MSVPKESPYGTFTGCLFQYHGNLVAFESSLPQNQDKEDNNNNNKKKYCILVGGLSDGLIPTPYTKLLEQTCHDNCWILVQPILSSSYLGFGHGTLQRDTNELCELMKYLQHHRSAQSFCFVGHSTGCQNSIHLLKNGSPDLIEKIRLIVLQAPVSDREHAMMDRVQYDKWMDYATRWRTQHDNDEKMMQELMPKDAFWAPMTVRRFLDLHENDGADDFFSNDFTDEKLQQRLGGHDASDCRILVAFSGADEYVPSHVDTRELTDRLCRAINSNQKSGDGEEEMAIPLYLPKANHNLSESEGDKEIFVQRVGDLLRDISAKDR